MKLILPIALLTFSLSFANAHASADFTKIGQDQSNARNSAQDLAADYIAQEEDEQSRIAMELAPIKSPQDVSNYLSKMPKEFSALELLPSKARQQFLRSLKFNEKGVTQFDYSVLQSLSPENVFRILSLFGIQSGAYLIKAKPTTTTGALINKPNLRIGDFLEDYRCEARATCSTAFRYACTSNC